MMQGSPISSSKWEVYEADGNAARDARAGRVRSRAEELRTVYQSEVEDVLAYLNGVRSMLLEREAYVSRMEHCRELATRATGRVQAYRTGVTSTTSNVERFVLELCDLERKLSESAAALTAGLEQAQRVINCLPDAEGRTVLSLRFLRGLKWSEIADRMQYSERNVLRLQRQALLHLSERNRMGRLPIVIGKEERN